MATLPTLPLEYIDTTYALPTGTTTNVNAGDNLQTAINSAALGDVLVLEAGATFTDDFTLPDKGVGTDWIYIISSDLASLPEGTRVGPADVASMAIMQGQSSGSGPVVNTSGAAHHYRFAGIKFLPPSGIYYAEVVSIGNQESSQAGLPHHITVDRCWIHGDDVQCRRGMAGNGDSIALIDSHLDNFRETGADSQAFWVYNGFGPFKIANNYLEGAGENIMFGGADPSITNCVPADIEIRYNYFFKPLAWQGSGVVVKNLLEFKNATRALVEGNRLENNWAGDGQSGPSVLLTPRNQSGGASWSGTTDITIRLNEGVNWGSGINISGEDDAFTSQRTDRVLIEDNVFTVSGLGGASARSFQITSGPMNVTIRNNTTFLSGGSAVFAENSPLADEFDFRNNVLDYGQYGFLGTDTGGGNDTLTTYFSNYTCPNNVWINNDSSGSYTLFTGSYFPANFAAVGFVDYAGGNYRLDAGSAYKNGGTDGTDPGADIDALEVALAGGAASNFAGAVSESVTAAAVFTGALSNYVGAVSESVTAADAVSGSVTALPSMTGLDFPGSFGDPLTIRFQFADPHLNGLPIWGPGGRGNTLIWRTFPKDQPGYFTGVFWANDGPWDTVATWGFHPYPAGTPPISDHHLWEIAVAGNDETRGQIVVWDQWYTNVARVWADGGGKHCEFYWNWPSLTDVITHTESTSYGNSNPANPALMWGDAAWAGDETGSTYGPWGATNEIHHGYMRGFQIYNNKLSLADVQDEIDTPLSTVMGAADVWYLNVNPTVADISDKSGAGNNPAWVGAGRPSDWSQGDATAPGPVINLTVTQA